MTETVFKTTKSSIAVIRQMIDQAGDPVRIPRPQYGDFFHSSSSFRVSLAIGYQPWVTVLFVLR